MSAVRRDRALLELRMVPFRSKDSAARRRPRGAWPSQARLSVVTPPRSVWAWPPCGCEFRVHGTDTGSHQLPLVADHHSSIILQVWTRALGRIYTPCSPWRLLGRASHGASAVHRSPLGRRVSSSITNPTEERHFCPRTHPSVVRSEGVSLLHVCLGRNHLTSGDFGAVFRTGVNRCLPHEGTREHIAKYCTVHVRTPDGGGEGTWALGAAAGLGGRTRSW